MPSTYSRRRLLAAGLGLATVGTLAGCSGSATSSTPDCTTEAIEHGSGELIQQAAALPDGDDVVLSVTLTESALESSSLDRLAVSDGFGNGFVIPVTDQRTYEQHVGQRPLHNRYVIVAVGQDSSDTAATGGPGPKLDSLTIDFHCTRETSA